MPKAKEKPSIKKSVGLNIDSEIYALVAELAAENNESMGILCRKLFFIGLSSEHDVSIRAGRLVN